jgi:hypothetical protein
LGFVVAFACYVTTLDFFGEGGTYFIFWWRFFLSSLESLDSLDYSEQEDEELEDSSEDVASLWALQRN